MNSYAPTWTLKAEERELYALISQAFGLRNSPYLVDAVDAIVDWHDRRVLRAFERRQQGLADLVRLLRDTAPERIPAVRRRAA